MKRACSRVASVGQSHRPGAVLGGSSHVRIWSSCCADMVVLCGCAFSTAPRCSYAKSLVLLALLVSHAIQVFGAARSARLAPNPSLWLYMFQSSLISGQKIFLLVGGFYSNKSHLSPDRRKRTCARAADCFSWRRADTDSSWRR